MRPPWTAWSLLSFFSRPHIPDDAMDDTDDDTDEYDDGFDGDLGGGNDERTLRRDYLFYLLSEIEGALDRTLEDLSQDDAATVGARLGRFALKVVQRRNSPSD
jgi:hypothetical protein